jgi:hypothetical protein
MKKSSSLLARQPYVGPGFSHKLLSAEVMKKLLFENLYLLPQILMSLDVFCFVICHAIMNKISRRFSHLFFGLFLIKYCK